VDESLSRERASASPFPVLAAGCRPLLPCKQRWTNRDVVANNAQGAELPSSQVTG
jgi:hypothetical protein